MSEFRPYDPHSVVRQTWRNLPHREQPGATYFVTFRLADSLPAEVRNRLGEIRDLNDRETFAWIDRHLDAGSGSCLFSQTDPAEIVVSTLRHFDGNRYRLGAFVVMPNHVHALVQPLEPHTRQQVVHSWKSYTANILQRLTAIHGRLWQEEGFDRIVRDATELRVFHDYIFANPAAARLPDGSFIVGQGTANWIEP
jgi:REP element-mobilizing transposase RayT